MRYHAPTKQFTIGLDAIGMVSYLLLDTMKHVRQAEGLPLEPYKRDGVLTNADYAQKNIIEAADKIGIDLGGRWGNEIDLREKP